MNTISNCINKRKWYYFLLFIVLIIKASLGAALAIILQKLIDSFSNTTKEKIIFNTTFVVGYIIVFALVNILSSYLISRITKGVLIDIKSQTVNNILGLSIPEFSCKNTASYISLLTNRLEDIETVYLSSIVELFDMGITLLISLFVLLYLSSVIGVVALISTLLALLVPAILSSVGNSLRLKYSKDQEEMTKFTKDILNGFELVKGYGVEKSILDQYNIKNKKMENSRFNLNFIKGLISGISMLFGYIVFFAVTITGLFLSLNTLLTVGTLIACINLSNGLVNPIMNGIQQIFLFKSMSGIREKFDIKSNRSKQETIRIKELQDRILLKNVNYSYPGKNGVQNINLEFLKGKKYAIVGSSGSGKSTILKILAGHLYDYGGDIYIDGNQLKQIDRRDLSRICSTVTQTPFLFDATIEDNIRFFQDISDTDVKGSINAAGLSEFINGRKDFIKFQVGEDGNNISGGEKQRIAIARAFARNSDIILLDEATSNLDNSLSRAIEEILINSESTIISVTHKLNEEMLKKYNMIIAMNNGSVIEVGTFDTLLSKKGLFYSLYYLDNINDKSI
ncbi:MAG: ABC transporter ATP-binding protein [Hungatella sp.]|nr:ABC transporter ATP-binding protein [Hungatella sp.]